MIGSGIVETMTSTGNSCSVCGDQLEPHTEAFCNSCGQPYHLNQRNDLAGRDCGQVWIHEEHLSLEFACELCLNPAPTGALGEILDIGEAATAAGVTEHALLEAARTGAVRHRQTAGGVYLFERADIATFVQGQQ